MRKESVIINGARGSKSLDSRLRYFGLFLGNRESAEVLNQKSDMVSTLVFRKKLRSCREDALKTALPVMVVRLRIILSIVS